MNREEVSRIVYEIIEEVERRDVGMEDSEVFEKVFPDYIRQELDECGCCGRCLCSEILEIVEERLGIIFERSYQITDEEYIDLIYSLVQKNESPIEILKSSITHSPTSFGSQLMGCYLPLIFVVWMFVYISAPNKLDIDLIESLIIALTGLACLWAHELLSDKDIAYYTEHEKKVILAYDKRQNAAL